MAVQRQDPSAGRPLAKVPAPRAASELRPAAGRSATPRPTATRSEPRGPDPWALVLWPALVALGVTLLRLVGELRGWSPGAFSRLPGGGLSPLGIAWLVPFVGFYFGWRLRRAGLALPTLSRAVGLPALALFAGPLLALLLGRLLQTGWTANFAVWAAVALLALVPALAAWPALGRPLLLYAVLSRLPVAAIAGLAVYRDWGTHYDVPPPGFPAMPPLKRWLWTGALPQATIWVTYTVALGAIFAVLGWQVAARVTAGAGVRRSV